MEELNQLLANLATYNNAEDGRNLVLKAANFAERCHQDILRLEGTPYILHLLAVATILSEWQAPPEILAAALLHDVFKQQYSHLAAGPDLKAELEAEFSLSLLSLARNVASLGSLGPSLMQRPLEVSAEQSRGNHNEGSRRFLWIYRILQQDPMAVVIKLADQMHDLQTHDLFPDEIARRDEEKWFAVALLKVFAPLADRMGMRVVREKLEDGAFHILDDKQYAKIGAYCDEVIKDAKIDQQVEDIQRILQSYHIEAQVFKSLEHRYAIFRRQLRSPQREVPSSDTFPIMFSIFVVVDSVADCYPTLGVLYSLWDIEENIHNTLTQPDANGYRALSALVAESSIGALHVVILTKEMYLVAKHGITARWRGVSEELLPKIEPLPERPLDHIMTITPKGTIIYLPRGATPIDFAYTRDEEAGHRLIQAWVNGKQVPLEEPLEDGAVVDTVMSRSIGKPSPDWLNSVVTPVAREAIARRTQQQAKEIELIVEGTDRLGLLGDVIDRLSMRDISMSYVHAEVIGERANIRARIQGVSIPVLEELVREIKSLFQVTQARWEDFSEASPQADPHMLLLMPRSGNPYSCSSPALSDVFKGRDREVQEVIERLRGNSLSNSKALLIWGQQRIGKTSLLLHLEKNLLPHEKYLIVYLSLQEVEGQSLGAFLHRIAEKIQTKLEFQREDVNIPDLNDMLQQPLRYFHEMMKQLGQVFGLQNLLIVLDEFQGISTLREEGATKEEVFSYFRSLMQYGMHVNFLLCGGGIYSQLLEESGINSLLALADPIHVDSLDEKAAIALVTGLDQSPEYEDRAVERLLKLTDCHPCYLTFLCRELYQSHAQQRIMLADVDKTVQQIVAWPQKLEAIIRHFWNIGLDNREIAKKQKRVLAAIAGETGLSHTHWVSSETIAKLTFPEVRPGDLLSLLTNLTDYGSIDRKGRQYRIHLPLLELWLRETQ